MEHMLQILILGAFGYLCGSFPTGKILGKLRGIDIQQRGSGNIGFANAVRVLGWRAGLLVLVIDVLKGFVPVLVAGYYLEQPAQLVVGTLAILGHVYPVWLRFKGGKGIATGLGVLLAVNPAVAAIGFTCYLLAFLMLRNSGQASLIGIWLLPWLSLLITTSLVWYCLFLAVLGTFTHRSNIREILKQPTKS